MKQVRVNWQSILFKTKSSQRRWQVTGSCSNKYLDFCPNSTIYSLGKQRNENLDKNLPQQQKCSSACDLSHEKGFDKLKVARSQNPNHILIAHLYNNSLKNKFKILKETIRNKVDILLISETKLHSSFPLNQFHIDGFTTPYRLDRNQNGGGIMLYIREDIPSKSVTEIKLDNEIENIFIEINLRSKKWLISGSCNPKLSHIKNDLEEIGKGLDYYSSKYENFIVLGDFNAEMSNPHTSEFCALYNFTNLIKEPTCYKNVDKPTSIDHILTNHARCFQHSGIYETGLSDFHKLTFTVLKMFYAKQKPRIIKYRDYKNFNKTTFRMDLLKELSLSNLQNGDFDRFKFIVNSLLESHAPMKEKYIRRNQAPFMNKSVRKAIMVRTKLLNKFRKENSFIHELEYKRQRNFCTTLIKKTKRNFYNNLSVSKIIDNK